MRNISFIHVGNCLLKDIVDDYDQVLIELQIFANAWLLPCIKLLLLGSGANIPALTPSGWTALHPVATERHEAVVGTLLRSIELAFSTGVNSYLPDSRGLTPLHLASAKV